MIAEQDIEQDNAKCAIIQFIDENSISTREKLIDLIPSSWIYKIDQNKYFCFYPDESDYCHMKNWLISLKSAETHWLSYEVTVITYASK